MKKILMVCLGNICRSPMAEGIMRSMVENNGLDWLVDSAGTNGFHIGEAPHRHSQSVCLSHGINISGQRARRFKTKDFDNYDVIYVLANDVYEDVIGLARNAVDKQKVQFLTDALFPDERRDVVDPWYGDKDGYEPVFQTIQAACSAIIKQIGD